MPRALPFPVIPRAQSGPAAPFPVMPRALPFPVMPRALPFPVIPRALRAAPASSPREAPDECVTSHRPPCAFLLPFPQAR
ncbi:unnamed protein product [Rangifer tarandus platyrhynchus]|uniref:Uncharacterized protein n=1 Tax=Rangifer tarandus platyrhynchus TaxID=3082113 RepID=A0ABN8ZUD3_RANTA|nr:unnamed protein product [Rangifer tarandus platyrhynchus]